MVTPLLLEARLGHIAQKLFNLLLVEALHLVVRVAAFIPLMKMSMLFQVECFTYHRSDPLSISFVSIFVHYDPI